MQGKLRLFGGGHAKPVSLLVREAEGADLAAADSTLSAKSKRLRDIPEHVREMTPWFAGAVRVANRYGTLSQQAAAYRMMALCLAGALVLTSGGLVWMSARYAETRVVPYIVRVDKLGLAVAEGPLERAAEADPVNVMSALARWIIGLRTVTGTTHLQREYVDRAFLFVGKGSVAASKVREWFASHPPLDGTGRRVRVDIQRVSPVMAAQDADVAQVASQLAPARDRGTQYRIEWVEEASDTHGEKRERSQWSALLSVSFSATQELQALIDNPVGVFVTDFSISKVQ